MIAQIMKICLEEGTIEFFKTQLQAFAEAFQEFKNPVYSMMSKAIPTTTL